MAFSPDGKTLASGDRSGKLKLWDVAAARERASAWPATDPICSLAFSPDGMVVASANGQRTVKLWEVATGREQDALHGPAPGIFCVAFSPDGRTLASGGGAGTPSGAPVLTLAGAVILWDVGSRREWASLEGPGGMVLSVAFSPDGRTLAAGGLDGTVEVWDLPAPRQAAR